MNKIQELHLELLKTINFKKVSGEKIVADLLAHPELWIAVYPAFRWHIAPKENPNQFWDPWHLYIFTVPGKEDELRSLADTWNPDTVCFYCENGCWLSMDDEPFFTFDEAALDNKKLFLRLWWDDVIYPPPDGQRAYTLASKKEIMK